MFDIDQNISSKHKLRSKTQTPAIKAIKNVSLDTKTETKYFRYKKKVILQKKIILNTHHYIQPCLIIFADVLYYLRYRLYVF